MVTVIVNSRMDTNKLNELIDRFRDDAFQYWRIFRYDQKHEPYDMKFSFRCGCVAIVEYYFNPEEVKVHICKCKEHKMEVIE
ncbi:MAG: hypothetical protein QW531_04885 [Thermoplasmata archaeon]